MAMTYQNFASLGVNLNRQKYGPLDISNVFTSENDLKYYLTKGAHVEGVSEYWYKNANEKVVPYPYEGQVLATVIDGVVNVYALALDAEGNFTTQEIAGKIEVDGTTIKLNDAGKLELVGLPADVANKTFVPSLVNGVLTWAEPDTSTAEGQQQAIDGLNTRVTALEEAVNGTDEADGLVKKVADNAQAVADEATARAEADEALKGKIAEALQAAKDYADANDANTVYDDAALAGRVAAIEEDYLKAADKYDDTALAGRVTEAEAAISANATAAANAVAAEKARAEGVEADLLGKINAIDFVDTDELAGAIEEALEPVNTAIAAKAAQTDLAALQARVEAFLDNTGAATEAIDTLQELITYINEHDDVELADIIADVEALQNKLVGIDGTVAEHVAAAIEALKIGDYAKAADLAALTTRVEALEAKPFDTYATKSEVEAVDAKFEQYTTTSDLNEQLAAKADADKVVANNTFETFQANNAQAIATAKQEAIDAAKAAEEAKGYAVASDVAATYATKAELTAHEEDIANELLAYAKKAEVEAELAKKIETGSIAHATDTLAEGVTVDGNKLNIVVDAFTKKETRDYVAGVIEDMTGGESAADVLLALNNYKASNDERVGAIETKDGEQDTAIAAAQAAGEQGIADAKAVADDLTVLAATVAENTREIGVAKGLVDTINETLSGEIEALKAKDVELGEAVAANAEQIIALGEKDTAIDAKIEALEAEDEALAALIQANTDKFDAYYDKTGADAAIKAAIDAIPAVDLSAYAKTADVDATIAEVNAAVALKADASAVYTKEAADAEFMTEAEVDARINALIVAADPEGGKTISDIQNLVKYVDENAGEIAGLVTATEANANKLAGIDTTVVDYVAGQIATVVTPKASTEVTVAEDGTLGIGEISIDKIVQGTQTLVLCGGDASK